MAEPNPHTEPHPDVAGYLLGTLDAAETEAFAEHLPGCHPCRSELAELAALPGLLADVPPSQELPAGLEQRTFAAIEAAAVVLPPATVVPIERARGARRLGPRRIALVAAAAAVALGLGVGVLASIGKGGGGQAPVATIRLISATGGPAHATAVVRTAPGGLSIDMQVDGLAPNPPGTMYTCWLVGPGDTLAHQNRVSVGSFVVGPSGAVHVRWTTAADLHRFSHLGVTLEPMNGKPDHQGPKVLAGP
jgi:anti-sigma-K factor RskA